MKVTITGAQNTGKSTFIDDIIKEFPSFKQPAYTYRDAIRDAGIENNINQETNIKSQRVIFNSLCDEVVRSGDDNHIIFDRCVMDAVAYTMWPLENGKITDITPRAAKAMKKTADTIMELYDLVIYIPADDSVEIVDDNLRATDPEYRNQMDQLFQDLLIYDINDPLFDKYGYKVATISGTREERIADFKELIALLS